MLSFENDIDIVDVEPKKGIVITFTNETFGGRQKSDRRLKPKESTDSPDMVDFTSSESDSSHSDYSTNDWLKFAWACENENVSALIELIESNQSSSIPIDRNCGSDCR